MMQFWFFNGRLVCNVSFSNISRFKKQLKVKSYNKVVQYNTRAIKVSMYWKPDKVQNGFFFFLSVH